MDTCRFHLDPATADLPAPRLRRRTPPQISLNLTSMIDVVFLLLIYFVVATNFKLGEEVYRMDLPERSSMQPSDPFDLDDEPLRIVVRSLGPAPDAYQLRLEGPWERVVTFDDLYVFLEGRRIGAPGSRGLFAVDHPIVVDPASDARWEHAIGAFNAAVRAAYENVTLSGS